MNAEEHEWMHYVKVMQATKVNDEGDRLRPISIAALHVRPKRRWITSSLHLMSPASGFVTRAKLPCSSQIKRSLIRSFSSGATLHNLMLTLTQPPVQFS
jgi:hypothetical protein